MRSRRTDRMKLAAAGVVLSLILLVSLNTFGALTLRPFRLDLTEDKAFTLSEGTRKLLASLKEPIVLRLYLSRSIRESSPFLAAYADRVRDLLQTYAELSNGRIVVRYIDPEPYSQEEDRAVGFGLKEISADGGNTSGYFGIAGTNSTDDVDVIPVLSPERERFLEYDLTRLVYNLADPDKPVVALISGLPISGDPALQYRPWRIYKQLGQQFDLRYLGGDVGTFDKDVDLLLVVHPSKLSDRTLYAIDQFVLHGGKALVFVDPHSEAASMRQRQPGMEPTSSTLRKLFDAWGIRFDENKVVADPATARQVQFPSGGRTQVVPYLVWLSLDRDSMNHDLPITSDLRRVNVATAGFLDRKKDAKIDFTPLLVSSPQAEAIDADLVRLFPDPLKLLKDYKPGDHALTMAALVSGTFKSAYPDGPPKGADKGIEHLSEAKAKATVMVVADTDLLDDRVWLARQSLLGQEVLVPLANNADFVANALDYLSGSEVLLGLRGRDAGLRPFVRIVELQRQAELRYRAKEQELLGRLSELQDKLDKLQVDDKGKAVELTEAQAKEILKLRGEILRTRAELREVQHALRQDIETLQARIRFANIAAMPILVGLIAILLAAFRRARFRRHVAAAR